MLDGLLQVQVQISIQIIGKLSDYISAVHRESPFRKYRFNFSRNFNRARRRRDFTAGTERPRASAVSSVESSSMSRSWKTTRNDGSSSPITWVRMPASSL